MKYIYSILFLFMSLLSSAQEQTMYWIGGAGNWDDLSHWSFQSGSQNPDTQPSSIPNAQTHVIFDENSGLTGVDTERTVTLRLASYNIKSLTFTNGISQVTAPIIKRSGDYSIIVSDNVTFQPFVRFNVPLIGNIYEGETKTITLNGILESGTLYEIGKEGLGTLTVDESLNNTNVTVNYGTLKLLGEQHTGGALAVYNNAVLEILTPTTISVYSFRTDATAYVNLTNCTNLDIPGRFWPDSSIPINFPQLETLYAGDFNNTNGNANLIIPNNTQVTTYKYRFLGNLNYTYSTIIILNGNFQSKNGNHYHKVIFKNPTGATAELVGSIEIDELFIEHSNLNFFNSITVSQITFAPSSVITLRDDVTLTITESLVANTLTCTPYLEFNANLNGNAKINNNTGGPIQIVNAILSNINSDGNYPINVIGIDNGGNSGALVFSEPAETTLYWVGDANDGEWHNIDNWAQTSGGQGGYCIPNRFTNVVFDENSVITDSNLKVTNNPASFHNMTITDAAPILNFNKIGNNVNFSCFGSWTMRSDISVNIDTYFRSTDTFETITSNTSIFSYVYFDGNATWKFLDDFKNRYNFYFRKGTLDTNGNSINIGNSFVGSENNSPKKIFLRNSEISINYQWDYRQNNSQLDAGTSHIILRSAREFINNEDHQFYNITLKETSIYSNSLLTIRNKLLVNNLTSEIKKFKLEEGAVANKISIMPTNIQSSTFFSAPVTTNILEIQKNCILSVSPNNIITVNESVITYSEDCNGTIEIYVSDKSINEKFTFKSLNDVHISNVLMIGVEADLSTGANYTASGWAEGLTSNWIFSDSTVKDLYWIGEVDNNWDNPLNWTTNSNGTPSIDGCIPDRNDNVHFNSFSLDINGNIRINIESDVNFSNIFIHDDFPGSFSITASTDQSVNAYGNIFQLKDMVSIKARVNHYGKGIVEFSGGILEGAKIDYLNLLGNSDNQIWNFNELFSINYDFVQNNGVLNYNSNYLRVGNFTLNDGVFNAPETLSANNIYLKQGDFNINDSYVNVSNRFLSNSNQPRSISMNNAKIRAVSEFTYNGTNNVISTNNSLVEIGGTISVTDNLLLDEILVLPNYQQDVNINGSFNVNKLTLSNNAKINNNLQIGELVILPKNLTLSFAENTTQTITNNMQLNGTPCQFNTIQGLGTGADIAYANPNDNNTFDFVQVSGINATDANLNFQVNSSNLGNNNNKVVFLQGSTGVIGLGPDKTCKDSFYVLAYGFYGGPLSEYTWYKKDENGDFINLNLPPDTLEINAFYYGLDGEYRVDMVYDATLPENLQCRQSDTVHITFAPMNVGFVNNPATFCENEVVTIADILITQETQDFMDEFNSEILWFANATDTTPLPTTTLLVDGTTYYATLLDDNGCYSNDRMPVLVEFYAKPFANAGPDQIDPNQTQFTMQANNPAVGVGTWTVVFGNVSIADPNSYNTQVTILSGESATLRWTVDNNGCTAADTVIIGKSITGNKVPRVNPNLRTRVF